MPESKNAAVDITEAVIASSPDAIIAADLDGTIIAWNPAAERMLGRPAEEVLGQPLLSMIPPEQRDEAGGLLEKARGGEVITARRVERIRADGSTISGSLTVAPIRDSAGAICGSVGIMHDTTDQRAIEELLRRNQRLASIGTLAAGIAHEINNPVGGILMAAQYAAGAVDRDDAQAVIGKALADIEADAKRCRDIVRGLLRFAREESAERSAHDPRAVVESAIDLAQKSLPGSAATVTLKPGPAVGPMLINETEIRQALVNIVVNAVQSGADTIDVTIIDDADALAVEVRDDGEGVSEDVIDHLFDPFFTTRRTEGATGLGLSLAHAIATDHGGSIDVASSNTVGTTVTLRLPRSHEDE